MGALCLLTLFVYSGWALYVYELMYRVDGRRMFVSSINVELVGTLCLLTLLMYRVDGHSMFMNSINVYSGWALYVY